MIVARIGVFVAITTVALLEPLPAQQGPLALGRSVRVVAPADGAIHRGRLILVLPDTVVLDDGHRMADHLDFVVLGSHARLEFPRRIGSHPFVGAVLGAGLGMAAGALSYSSRSVFSCVSDCSGPPSGLGRTGRAVVGGLIGVAVGSLVGAHVYTTLWDPVPPDQIDRLRVGLVAQPRSRLGLGASLGF
jgi:hypothetical protein